MKNRKRLLVLLVLCIIVSSFTAINAEAACSHSSLGPKYSEATHPHAYYRTCNTCGVKVYVGGYQTKAHGNGAWGSGTCPSCGTHSYVGRTCTNSGKCSCGATIAAYGHTLGTQYSEATHPHAYYRSCSRCGQKVYVGGYQTKAHGNGAWGSGTCPSCGTHSYVGRTCTDSGKCSCGATIAAYGHAYGNNSVYYESAHPHKDYKLCRRCGVKSYTGTYTTLNHGSGSDGTCKSCGEHDYRPWTLAEIAHPHKTTLRCELCYDTITKYMLSKLCTSCIADSKTATSSTGKTGLLSYVAGDLGWGTTVLVPVTFYVEYTNTYKFYTSTTHDDPAFVSWYSKVSSHCEGQDALAPNIFCVSNPTVIYYDKSGNRIASQELAPHIDYLYWNITDAVDKNQYYYWLNTKPYYAEAYASCNAEGSAWFINGSTRTYFS